MSVIIAGGGMAGATLALALSRFSQGRLSVQLIDGSVAGQDNHPGFDARSIALAQGTCQQLQRIGVWQEIADDACAIDQVHVSDQGHAGFVTINARDYQTDALGYVVELHKVGQRLFTLLQQATGVTLHCPARVRQIHRTADKVRVTLDNGHSLDGKLLIAADGSHSAIARQCGIQQHQLPYQQLAVIANIKTEKPHQGQAFERFTRYGPLALLPLSADRYSLVWCHPLSQQQQIMAWSEHQFCQQLQQAFGWRCGRITRAGNRSAYPLSLSRASRIITHRLALVGNAAQTLHPVAGQGFNLGMRDVITLAETLTQAECRQQDMGSYSVLASYQQRRKADTDATIGLTDGLIHLFANHWQPLVTARNMALVAMELIPPLRDNLAHRALGRVSD